MSKTSDDKFLFRNFIQSHLKQCKYAIVQCLNMGCGQRMYRSDVELHSRECKFMPIQCQWCRKDIPRQNENVSNSITSHKMCMIKLLLWTYIVARPVLVSRHDVRGKFADFASYNIFVQYLLNYMYIHVNLA